MSRVANRIINALSIPAVDVYEIGPNVVAVNPVWQTAIQQWVNDHGQKWYSNWFGKGYLASKVQIGSPTTQHVWCIHRGRLKAAPKTLAEQCARFRPLTLGTRPTNDSCFTATVQGIVMANTAGRMCDDDRGNLVIAEITTITGVQKQFAGTPIGANVDIIVNMRPDKTLATVGSEAGPYIVAGRLTSTVLPAPKLNMLLIEGPSTFDYGEVSPWYEFFLVMNTTLRQDMIEASQREPQLKLRSDSVNLENDPAGGLGYLRIPNRTSINPFHMIPNFRPYADEIFISNEMVGSVPMSDIRKNWRAETVFVGGFSGDEVLRTSFPEGVTDDDEAERIASLDTTSATMTIRSSNAVFVHAKGADGVAVTATLTGDLAVVVLKRLSMRGIRCTVNVDTSTAPKGDGQGIMALLVELGAAMNAQSVLASAQTNLRTGGQTDQVGYSALVAAAKLMSYDQRLIASSLLIPGMVYNDVTARSIAR